MADERCLKFENKIDNYYCKTFAVVQEFAIAATAESIAMAR